MNPLFCIIVVTAFIALNSGAPAPPERFGGFVPWASKTRRPSSPNLGNLACYDCVNREGRKFLSPTLSAKTYKYCVVFKDSDSFFLFGYPFANKKLDAEFEKHPNATQIIITNTNILEFGPDFPHTATFCRDQDGCNDLSLNY